MGAVTASGSPLKDSPLSACGGPGGPSPSTPTAVIENDSTGPPPIGPGGQGRGQTLGWMVPRGLGHQLYFLLLFFFL